jgi:GNAT superfamily N-acetyltransferase
VDGGSSRARRGDAADRRPGDRPLAFREGEGRWLDASSAGDLQRLIDACADDLRLATGGDPAAADAWELLKQPPGVEEDQRIALGVFEPDGRLAAAVDVYRDFPQQGSWYLALALVRPDLRGRGLATGILSRLERVAREHGGEGIHVIAPARNPAVLQLFRRAGYVARRDVSLPFEGRSLRGIHLVRELAASAQAPSPRVVE